MERKNTIRINLTLKQIHGVLCPKCKDALIKLASTEGAVDYATKRLSEALHKQLGEQ
jgi:hypothetical protein